MSNIINNLEPLTVKLDDILLDPNNPRFLDVASNKATVKESRFEETRIQEKTLLDMQAFDIEPLKQTMLELGFLPIDKIVVRRWKDSKEDAPKYVVIEGNRRIAALKNIIKSKEDGHQDLTEDQYENFNNLDVYLINDDNELYFTLIPGLRHVSGIKQWGVYQQSKLISTLRDDNNYSAKQAASSLGITTRECNRLYRAFKALIQAQGIEDFENEINEKKFSYFEEALKNSKVKEWMEWNDESNSFSNINNLKLFIEWMIGKDDDDIDGERLSPRLLEAKSVRDLNKIIDTQAFSIFMSDINQKLETLVAEENIKYKNLHWEQNIKEVLGIIQNMSAKVVKEMTDTQKDLLNELCKVIGDTLEDNRKLNV